MSLKFGNYYSYASDTMVYLVGSKEIKSITGNTPFIALQLTTPEGWRGDVLKVLTNDGFLGYIGYVPEQLKEVHHE